MADPGNPELLPDLLARCRAGDRSGFDVLVRRFHPYALSLAATLLNNNRGQAEDAVQSAFVTVLTRLGDLRGDDAFPGWLRQIVRTECTRLTRGTHPTTLAGDHIAPTSSPADALAHRELLDRVRAAVAGLPAVQREAAELFYLDDLPQADISRTLDVPEGTVKRRLFDARANLRAALSDTDKPKPRLPI